MNEIKCPKCGEVFQVDESHYAAIVKQVRDKEFSAELKNREFQFKETMKNTLQLTKLQLESEYNQEINKLKSKLSTFNKDKELEIANLITDMNNRYASQENFILKLTNDSELAEKEYKLREQSLKEQQVGWVE